MDARSRVLWTFFSLLLSIECALGKTPSGNAGVVQWARSSLTPLSAVAPGRNMEDLTPLGRMIGNATIVTLGEGVHAAAEPLEFRNRLLQYLVEQKGFTAIAIESGIVESRAVHDYVAGGDGDFAATLANGLSWTFDRLPQNEALIRWLREYNADPQHVRKIEFYGFDVPGSPGNPRANRGVDTALVEALKYLDRVDSASAVVFRSRLGAALASVKFDAGAVDKPGPNYPKLNQTERDSLTANIADLIALMERREARYISASTQADYEWAYRAAIGARQVDNWLRETPMGSLASDVMRRALSGADDARDRAQADNLQWIVDRLGPAAKVLVFAHNGHLGMTPPTYRWRLLNGAQDGSADVAVYEREVAGTYLHRRFGNRLVSIGNVIGKGEAACAGFAQTLRQAPADSITGVARGAGSPLYVLDLRAAPPPVAAWLDQKHSIGRGAPYQKYDIFYELPFRKTFDVLFYIDTVTPACK